MVTHSNILAWRFPGMREPDGLPSLGSHRVRQDWSNLAAAAAPRPHLFIVKPILKLCVCLSLFTLYVPTSPAHAFHQLKLLFSTLKWSVSRSVMPDSETPWTAAQLAPLSMGFSRQGYWGGLPFPSSGDLPKPGIEPRSPALLADSLPTKIRGKPLLNSRHRESPNHSWPSSLFLSHEFLRNLIFPCAFNSLLYGDNMQSCAFQLWHLL